MEPAGAVARSEPRAMPAVERTESVVRQGWIGAAGGIVFGIHDSVKNLLGRSFPNPGDDAKITAMFAAAVRDDSLGIPATFEAGELWFTYPTAILSAVRH